MDHKGTDRLVLGSGLALHIATSGLIYVSFLSSGGFGGLPGPQKQEKQFSNTAENCLKGMFYALRGSEYSTPHKFEKA